MKAIVIGAIVIAGLDALICWCCCRVAGKDKEKRGK